MERSVRRSTNALSNGVNGKFVSDEPVSSGRKGYGARSLFALLSSLASCNLDHPAHVYRSQGLGHTFHRGKCQFLPGDEGGEDRLTIIDRDILFLSPVDDDQKTKLLEIASQCPISKILEGEIKVRSFVYRDGDTKKINYANDEITVVWKPAFCQHSTRCWTQLPTVFNPRVRHWIDPNGAGAERIERQVKACPTGALEFLKKGGASSPADGSAPGQSNSADQPSSPGPAQA